MQFNLLHYNSAKVYTYAASVTRRRSGCCDAMGCQTLNKHYYSTARSAMKVKGLGICVDLDGDNNIHETGIVRIDFINDRYGDLFYVLLLFFSMFLLACIDIRNRYRFQKSDGRQGGAAIMLPSYFTYLTLMAAVNLVFGVIFLASYVNDHGYGSWTNLILMSIQFG